MDIIQDGIDPQPDQQAPEATPARRTAVFIVRIWLEHLLGSERSWRGEIEHVGQPCVTAFGSLEQMTELIQEGARASREGPSHPSRKLDK